VDTRKSTTVADQIADVLSQRILIGDLPPGSRLRQESIAYEFGASHVPVREAFRRLEAQQLLVSEPRRGVRVTSLDRSGEREIVKMRAVLEVLALRSIVGKISSKHLTSIEGALEAGDRARDIFEWEAANRAFHFALAVPCGMPRLLASLTELHLASSRYVFAQDRSAQWQPRSNHDHRRIHEALVQGQTELAANLLHTHIGTMERVTERKQNSVG